jgi:hypothetical protein
MPGNQGWIEICDNSGCSIDPADLFTDAGQELLGTIYENHDGKDENKRLQDVAGRVFMNTPNNTLGEEVQNVFLDLDTKIHYLPTKISKERSVGKLIMVKDGQKLPPATSLYPPELHGQDFIMAGYKSLTGNDK